MTDYRSLEQKIRQVVYEASMNRNTELRRKVENVGRPKDDVKDAETSKLAKQGEIKTKIIDEEILDEMEKDQDKHFESQSKKMQDAINLHTRKGKSYWEAVRAAKVHVKEEVSDAAKKVLGDVAKKHGGQVPFKSTTYKDGKRVVTHGYNDEKGNRVVTKTTNEEVELDEAAPKWDEKEFKLVRPGTWKHSSGSSIHYGNGSKSYRVMHGNESDPKKYSTLDGAQKAVRAKHVNEEVEQIEEISKDLATRYKEKVLNMPADEQDKEKPRQKINRMIGAARAIGKIQKDPKRKVHATEEYVEEVATDAGPNQPMDNESKKVKKPDNKDMKKKPDAQDEDDPREIKGGTATVVDLNPKTNDNINDENEKEDSAAKKAKKAANKDIGQTGAKQMKEGINFGLPQSVIDAVRQVVEATHPKTDKEKDLAAKMPPKDKITHADVLKARGVKMDEELKGNQHKIDANKNGKVDAHDFKILRGETKTKAKPQYDKARPAFKKMEEARGVAPQAVDKHNCATHVYHEEFGEGKPIHSQHAEPDANGLIEWYDVMFGHGIEKQVMVSEMKILASEGHMNHKKKMKEEVEEVNELSTATRASYRAKAVPHAKSLRKLSNTIKQVKTDDPDVKAAVGDVKKDTKRKLNNRVTGILRSTQKEEVQFSETELARIEEIAKGLE